MNYRAVIFDLFYTLIYMTPTGMREKAMSRVEAAGIARDDWHRAWRATQKAAMRGEIRTLRERVAAVLKLAGAAEDEGLMDELAGLPPYRDYPLLYPEVRAALVETRARGYRLGLVSNTTRYDSVAFDAFDLAPLFEATTFSFEVGLLKPEPAIFLVAAKQLEVEPTECVFVDDRMDYLQGARAVGVAGVHLKRPGAMLRDESGECELRIGNLLGLLTWLPEKAG